jgi:hypothetical protein
MRKCTLLLSVLLAVAVSTTADAAKKKHHKMAAEPAITNVDATDAQRTKFFQDMFNPMGAK